MIEEVFPQLFRVKIPLPKNPLRYLNSYFVLGTPRNLIIDTGLNRAECLEAMLGGIQTLGVDLNRTDFYITHFHADHFALAPKLATENSRIFINRPDGEIIKSGLNWENILQYACLNGFPQDEIQTALKKNPGFEFGWDWVPALNFVSDGDNLYVGDYNFTCLFTPGHSYGHSCLWEQKKKLLIAGDHILGDITPNIQCLKDGYNPLANYLGSLDLAAGLDIDLVLPGHRELIPNWRKRINELKECHFNRLKEIVGILTSRKFNAYQIAARIDWDIDCQDWKEFPVAQRWFATGEAIAHLHYLEEKQIILRGKDSENISYQLNPIKTNGAGF